MPVYEGPTIDEAIAQGLHALGLKKEAATIEILTDAKKGFLGMGKKAARVSIEPIEIEEAPVLEPEAEEVAAEAEESNPEPVKATEEVDHLEDLEKEDAIKELALYLTNITNELNAPALVKMKREDGLILFQLDTQKQGILIGKHGKMLNALQYLAQVFIHRVAKNKLSVVVNVGDYRQKRQAILERLADRTAEKVKRTGRPVFLEPMPAFERKQIHFSLSKDPAVQTHSEGDEPYRYLVVEPAKRY